MVLTNLLISLHGDSQLKLAVQTLKHLESKQNGPVLRDFQNAEQALSPALLEAVHRKPDDGRTTQRAMVELLSSMIKVVKPAATAVAWLSSEVSRCTLFLVTDADGGSSV